MNTDKTNTQGIQTISFGNGLLKRLRVLAMKVTNGNMSELVRAIAEDSLDRIERDELKIQKARATLVRNDD